MGSFEASKSAIRYGFRSTASPDFTPFEILGNAEKRKNMQIETIQVAGFEPALRGMRNPYKNRHKSDSGPCCERDCFQCPGLELLEPGHGRCRLIRVGEDEFYIGPKDLQLARQLAEAGPDHGKYLRQIVAWADVTATRAFWSEFDTYRAGVEKQSESTMHTLLLEHLEDTAAFETGTPWPLIAAFNGISKETREELEHGEITHVEAKNRLKKALPEGFLQKRTVMLSYAALRAIYKQRRNHELQAWQTFCDWIEGLPYAELITGKARE